MTGDESIELWFNRYQMDALEAALGEHGESVESKMRELLEKLYEDMVPEETRRQIDARLQAEYEADTAAAEANRRFAVFRVREHSGEICFLVDRPTNFLDAATTFRNYRQGSADESPKRFADCYSGSQGLSRDELRQYLSERLEKNSGRLTGAFDFDIDEGTVTTLGEDNAWHSYRLKDVSAAAYYAHRGRAIPYLQRNDLFLDHLAVRELRQEPPGDLVQGDRPVYPQGPVM